MRDTYRHELVQVAASAIAAITVLDTGCTFLMPFLEEDEPLKRIFADVCAERQYQENKWGVRYENERGALPLFWLAVIGEEVGEACAAVLEGNFK